MSKKDTLSKNLIKNSKNGALSKNLNMSLKRFFIKNLNKILYKNLIKNLEITL